METTHQGISPEEVKVLSESIPGASGGQLQALWDRVQMTKYDQGVDFAEILFRYIELPLIKRIYPPEEVNVLVKKWISFLKKKASKVGFEKMTKYLEMRRYGVGIDKAREAIQPIYPQEFLDRQVKLYGRPFTYKYEISMRDADLLYFLKIGRFVQLFYDRFYQPVTAGG